jgi:competence protein ComGC
MEVLRKLYKIIKTESGSTLIYILIVLIVVSVLATSVLFVFNNNLKQTKHIQDQQEAYYLAYSGIEMGLSALLADDGENIDKLIREVNPEPSLTETDIDFGNGKITLVAVESTDTNFLGWIKLTATATLNRNGQTARQTLYFDPDNPVDAILVE